MRSMLAGKRMERRSGRWDSGKEIKKNGERATNRMGGGSVEGRGEWDGGKEIREHGEGVVVEGRGGGWDDSMEMREEGERKGVSPSPSLPLSNTIQITNKQVLCLHFF